MYRKRGGVSRNYDDCKGLTVVHSNRGGVSGICVKCKDLTLCTVRGGVLDL